MQLRSQYLLMAFAITFLSIPTNAQTVNQLILVNGGVFGDPSDKVTVATMAPDLSGYTVFDEIGTEAAQDIAVRENLAWVAALDTIVAYDIDTYTRIGSAYVPGVNQIEPFGDYLLVGLGFGGSGSFLQVRNATDLSLVSTIPVFAETGGIIMTPNRAYVAVPGDFYTTSGSLAVIDLVNLSLIQEIALGADGNGINAIFLESGYVIAVCGGSGNLLAINPTSGSYTVEALGSIASYSGAAKNGDRLYFQYGGFFDARLGEFNLSTRATENDILIPGAYAEIQVNPISNNLYRTTTDYFSTGTLHRHDNNGTLINEITVGVSPEHLAVDVRGNCIPPESISVLPTATNATITWNAIATATSYKLTGRESGAGGLNSLSTSGTSLIISDLMPATTYEFALRAVCGTENSDFSTVRVFTTPIIRTAEIYTAYEITDLNGRIVASAKGIFRSGLKNSELPMGIYLLTQFSENNSETHRIIIE
ncbi:MAG: hypothetical protein ACI959_001568 [Limisphaerales bacterium]|jgi:hypothetical protein